MRTDRWEAFPGLKGKIEPSKEEDERKKNKIKSSFEKPNEGSENGRLQPDCELAEWKRKICD